MLVIPRSYRTYQGLLFVLILNRIFVFVVCHEQAASKLLTAEKHTEDHQTFVNKIGPASDVDTSFNIQSVSPSNVKSKDTSFNSQSVPFSDVKSKDTPFSSQSVSFSDVKSKDTPFNSQPVPFSDVKSKDTPFNSQSVPNSNVKSNDIPFNSQSVPFSNVKSKDTPFNSQSVPFSDVKSKDTPFSRQSVSFSDVKSKDTPFNSQSVSFSDVKPKDTPFHSQSVSFSDVKSKDTSFNSQSVPFSDVKSKDTPFNSQSVSFSDVKSKDTPINSQSVSFSDVKSKDTPFSRQSVSFSDVKSEDTPFHSQSVSFSDVKSKDKPFSRQSVSFSDVKSKDTPFNSQSVPNSDVKSKDTPFNSQSVSFSDVKSKDKPFSRQSVSLSNVKSEEEKFTILDHVVITENTGKGVKPSAKTANKTQPVAEDNTRKGDTKLGRRLVKRSGRPIEMNPITIFGHQHLNPIPSQMPRTVRTVVVDTCEKPLTISGSKAGIIKFKSKHIRSRLKRFACEVVIEVSPNRQILTQPERAHLYCSQHVISIWETLYGYRRNGSTPCVSKSHTRVLSMTNRVHFLLSYKWKELPAVVGRKLIFTVYFMEIDSGQKRLKRVVDSPSSGQLLSVSQSRVFSKFVNIVYSLTVPSGLSVMISFPLLHVGSVKTTPKINSSNERGILTLFEVGRSQDARIVWNYTGSEGLPAQLFSSSLIFRFVDFTASKGLTNPRDWQFRVKILYSFHPANETPVVVSEGKWNCTVAFYSSFSQHLDCNLYLQCEGQEDERGHCPFSSPACNGSVAAGRHCYIFPERLQRLSWHQAHALCERQRARLVSLSSAVKLRAFLDMVRLSRRSWLAWVGARWVPSYSDSTMYVRVWQWLDQTTLYDRNIKFVRKGKVHFGHFENCLYLNSSSPHYYNAVDCSIEVNATAPVCEYDVATSGGEEVEPLSTVMKTFTPFHPELSKSMTHCTSGHYIHDFLACDPDTHCQPRPSRDWCEVGEGKVRMFQCEDGSVVHYSLVCDQHKHCADNSDEAWCSHSPLCEGYQCQDSQCIPLASLCNLVHDCLDRSDERVCERPLSSVELDNIRPLPLPALIEFDGMGHFSYSPLDSEGLLSASCPDTHFQCPEGYCLPVYVRCNGVYDCPHHEDEAGCVEYTCPGFYRCHGSPVCVHPRQVCDGKASCPQQDDEWRCGRGAPCPAGCHCQGLALLCTAPFPTAAHPHLRYLDAGQSGLTPADVSGHVYLVELHLPACGLTSVTTLSLPNLRVLDLSHNRLTWIHAENLTGLHNLQSLLLSFNPITSLIAASESPVVVGSLRHLDLSFTALRQFGSDMLHNFPSVSSLNLSYTPIRDITTEGLSGLAQLTVLDARETPVDRFPLDMLRNLSRLTTVSSFNYKLCCGSVLPPHFDPDACSTPLGGVLACEDLLPSNAYRWVVWVQALACVAANSVCVGMRCHFHRNQPPRPFHRFLSSLHVANFLTGVYLVMIASGDQTHRGRYLREEKVWKESLVCHTAGFFAALSTKVSTLLVCLLTLDRLLAIRFPQHSRFHFGTRSSLASLVTVWTIAVVIAGVPLLPAVSHWRFYNVYDTCMPLPVTSQVFPGHAYSIGTRVVLDLALLFPAALGKAVVRWTVGGHVVTLTNSQACRDMLQAVRFLPLGLSDMVAWGSVAFVALFQVCGNPVPAALNLALGLLVVPLNASLNPLLYHLGAVREKRRRREEEKLLEWFKTRVQTRPAVVKMGAPAVTASTQNALRCIRENLRNKVISLQSIEERFLQ